MRFFLTALNFHFSLILRCPGVFFFWMCVTDINGSCFFFVSFFCRFAAA